MLTLILACAGAATGGKPPPDAPSTEVAPLPPPPPPPPPVDDAAPAVATWVSPSCGEREYPRHVVLNPDFSFEGRDLISPCPPDVACVWSGVELWTGTWSQDPERVLLVEAEGNPPAMSAPHPTELLRVDGALAEVDGAARCLYTLSPGETPQGEVAPP